MLGCDRREGIVDVDVLDVRRRRQRRELPYVWPHGDFDAVDPTRRHVEDQPRTVGALQTHGTGHALARTDG